MHEVFNGPAANLLESTYLCLHTTRLTLHPLGTFFADCANCGCTSSGVGTTLSSAARRRRPQCRTCHQQLCSAVLAAAAVLLHSEKDDAMCASLFCLLPILAPRPDLMESLWACWLGDAQSCKSWLRLTHLKVAQVIRVPVSSDLAKGPVKVINKTS